MCASLSDRPEGNVFPSPRKCPCRKCLPTILPKQCRGTGARGGRGGREGVRVWEGRRGHEGGGSIERQGHGRGRDLDNERNAHEG